MDRPLFVRFPVDGHVGCYRVLAVASNASVSTAAQFVCEWFSVLEWTPGSGIPGSRGNRSTL